MRRILLVLFLFAISAILQAAEPVRVWTSKNGNTLKATYEADVDDDPETVYLLKDGDLYKILFKNLSPADQKYVNNIRTGKGIAVVPSGRQFALLIGVNRYAKPFKSLHYCVSDMVLLSDCFQTSGMPKENITLVTDDSSFERRPTGINIRRQIEIVTSILEPADQLIVVYSGHGATVDGTPCLCPSDADVKNKRSFVSCDWVFEQLDKCKAKKKAFVIDACRSDTDFIDGIEAEQIQPLNDPIGAGSHGFILIASCDKNQQSWEHSELLHGVFAYFMADGLLGAAADKNGSVTINSLFQYASSKTEKFVDKKLEKAQVPIFRPGNEIMDFSLARMESAPNKAKDKNRKVYKINGVEFAFRYCPPGTFLMGSPKGEYIKVVRESGYNKKLDDYVSDQIINHNREKQHKVILTQGFWIMETEVTQKQWSAIMGENPFSSEGDDLPASPLSWDDCQRFCKKCTALGLPVQLPTEAQWEYACRAGTTGPYAGDPEEMALISYNIFNLVGQKKPNAWGLYDMHGNVAEWCQDWFDDDYYDSFPNGVAVDPTGPSRGSERVVRGKVNSIPLLFDYRSACRDGSISKGDIIGFRCVKMERRSAPVPSKPTKAGDRKVIKVDGLEFAFRWCPPGTFIMGSPIGEPGKKELNRPYRNYDEIEIQHQVTLTKGFWMLETEVTVGMFKAFVDETGYVSRGYTPYCFENNNMVQDSKFSWKNPGFTQDDDHPVVCVSWDDAMEFCKWLSRKTGMNVTLPTEAQWEYACRAGSKTALPNGFIVIKDRLNIPALDPIAWYIGNSSQGFKGYSGINTRGESRLQYPGGPSGTHPVGKKNPNNWGLYDMIGNVFEWCFDVYEQYPNGSVTDPVSDSTNGDRIVRGGSWDSAPGYCRSASRSDNDPRLRYDSIGFRVSITQ